MSLLMTLMLGVSFHPGLAQEKILLQQLGTEALFLSNRPIDARIDTLVMQQQVMARASEVVDALGQAGVQVGSTAVLNLQDTQGQLSQPGVVIVLGAQALSHELFAFVHDGAARPIVYRIDENRRATLVTLTRGNQRFGNGEKELNADGTETNLLLFNGNPYQGIDELLVAPGQQAQQLIQFLKGVGLSVTSIVNLNQQTAMNFANSGVGFMARNSDFRTAGNDQFISLATDLRIYALESKAKLVELNVFRSQSELLASNSSVDDEEETMPRLNESSGKQQPTSQAPAKPLKEYLAETMSKASKVSPTVSNAEPSQTLKKQEDMTGSKTMSREVVELLEKARAQSDFCGNFFTWLSRYYLEYDLNPYGPSGFGEQSEELLESASPLIPIAKLFTEEGVVALFGLPSDQVTYLMADRLQGYIPACFQKVFGSARDIRSSHGQLLTLMKLRFGDYPNSRKLKQAVTGVDGAYEWFEDTIRHLTDPPVALTSNHLMRFEEQAPRQAEILWPSDASKFMSEVLELIAMRREEAQRNDQLAVEAQRQREIDAAERAERKRLASISDCIGKMTHPDDPDRSPDIDGYSDEAVLNFATTSIDDCSLALEEHPEDPQVSFYMGRAYLFSDHQEQAIDYLIDAAKGGNAVAFSYLAELDPDPSSAMELLSISADLGFLPAFDMLDELEDHIVELEAFERERLAEEERVEAETKQILEEQRTTALECDRVALHPMDRLSDGIAAVEDESLDLETVIEMCTDAVVADPANGRLRFQLVRGLSLLEGFEEEVIDQLERASSLSYGLATYVLFQLEEDPVSAFRLLEKAAGEGVEEAVANLGKIPQLPQNPEMEMFYQDLDRLYSISDANPLSRDIIVHSTENCMQQYRMWSGDMRVGFLQFLQTIVYPGTTMLDGVLATAALTPEARDRRAESWCGIVAKEYGTCVDVYLSDVNGDVLEQLDDVTYNTILLANSQNAKRDDGWFDRSVGPLTDYAGYFYARKLGILTPFEDVAFDENYMFEEGSDPFVVDVAREIIKEDKLFVVTQAISSEHLCQ